MLDSSRLRDALQAKIQSYPEFSEIVKPQFLKDFCEAIATTVVAEIQNNADIEVGIQSTGTVTSGAGAGGNVQTTSLIKVGPGAIQ